MRKTIFAVLIVVASVLFGADDEYNYVYWQVNQNGGETIRFDYAAVAVFKDGQRLKDEYGYDSYLGDVGSPTFPHLVNSDESKTHLSGDGQAVSAILKGWQGPGYSFMLELFDENDMTVGWAVSRTVWEELEAFSSASSTDPPVAGPWNAAAVGVVPEPSSSLLLLIGISLLSLRRKV